MASSLDKLSSNLDDEQCENIAKEYQDEDMFGFMRCKGVYPYEYVYSWERFNETQLPEKDAFYCRLNLSEISKKDYKHAQKVWNSMSKKSLGCYHGTYLKTLKSLRLLGNHA